MINPLVLKWLSNNFRGFLVEFSDQKSILYWVQCKWLSLLQGREVFCCLGHSIPVVKWTSPTNSWPPLGVALPPSWNQPVKISATRYGLILRENGSNIEVTACFFWHCAGLSSGEEEKSEKLDEAFLDNNWNHSSQNWTEQGWSGSMGCLNWEKYVADMMLQFELLTTVHLHVR